MYASIINKTLQQAYLQKKLSNTRYTYLLLIRHFEKIRLKLIHSIWIIVLIECVLINIITKIKLSFNKNWIIH